MKVVTTEDFFDFLFAGLEGYFCLVEISRAVNIKTGKKVKQHFFSWPDEMDEAYKLISERRSKVDLYFSPFLTIRKRRKKEDIIETPVAWADGDLCPIESLLIQPSAVVRSSKTETQEKYHFYWKFDEVENADIGELVSKRIAYYHADEGMDRSGWDLTQLLRIPGTYNHKYTPYKEVSKAVIDRDALYKFEDFNVYPEIEGESEFVSVDEVEIPDETPQQIFDRYKDDINPRALDLFTEIPTQDWSKSLWELELTLLEGGLTKEETFVITRDSACNQYRRDGRSERHLWVEIQKAANLVTTRHAAPITSDNEDANALVSEAPDLLTKEEKEIAERDRTFVEEYTDWAKGLGDAAPQYHPAGAFTILSTVMCGTVKLPTSFGTLIPNLWFMILADTTLTRKSTAMDNAMDLLLEVDSDLLMATDGSVEGLLTALAVRSGQPSLFLRDEITGFIEAITKKEYLAGMMETLTKLYDGKTMKRILRRETIDVRDPRMVFFSGGIRNKMMDILDHRHVSSGFLPRIIFVTAESDITRLKPIGPPTEKDNTQRDYLIRRVGDMYRKYSPAPSTTSGTTVTFAKQWPAELTTDAWHRYNAFEVKMLDFAMKSSDPTMLTPMMDRLAKSGLKASVLLAASKMPEEKIVVTTTDLVHAFSYINEWMKHSLYIISNIGTSQDERKIQKIVSEIQANPGIMRSTIMQKNYLTAREADHVFITLEQRGAIRREKRGARAERLYPTA